MIADERPDLIIFMIAVMAMWTRVSLLCRFTDTSEGYTEPVPLKYGKLATKYPGIRIFFTVHD